MNRVSGLWARRAHTPNISLLGRSRATSIFAAAVIAALVASPLAASGSTAAMAAQSAPTSQTVLPAADLISDDPTMSVSPSKGILSPDETWNGQAKVTTQKVASKVDLMFAIDHTGSMASPIKWVAQGLSDTVKRLKDAGATDINIGVTSYSDITACGSTPWFYNEMALGDNSSASLTNVFNQISSGVGGAKYCSGGDAPESGIAASQRVAAETPWRDGSTRYVVNVSDASMKVEAGYSVGGFPATVDGLKSVLDKYKVNLSLQAVNCSAGSCAASGGQSAATIAAATGAATAMSSNATELNNNIFVKIVGAVQTWDITHVESCVYVSDKAPSRDINLSVTPAKVTVNAGESALFPEVATAVATPDRYGDTTECTIQFLVNGNAAPAYQQKISLRVDDNGVFDLSKSSDPVSGTTLIPGQSVEYTVVAENTTKKAMTGATFTDNLSNVLDDATVDAASVKVNGPGTAALSGSQIVWTGDLPSGAKATVTYKAVVGKPVPAGGNHLLKNVVSSTTDLSTCPVGVENAACQTEHPIRGLVLAKSLDNSKPAPGDTVVYTITAFNDSSTATTTSFTDNLSDVLDDATYSGDVRSSVAGATVDVAGKLLTWSGTMAPRETVTITYSVVVNTPSAAAAGDNVLRNSVVSTDPVSNCPAASSDPACHTVTDPIPGLTVVKTAVNNPSAVGPGDTVDYQVVATNSGGTDLKNASFTDDLTDVLDDADYQKDAAVTAGTIEYKKPKLEWSGNLARGEAVTLTYSVKLTSPAKGNHLLENTVVAPQSNCAAGSSSPLCHTQSPSPALTVSKELVGSPAEVNGGQVLTYLITASNTGKVDLPAADLRDDLADVLDDADFAGADTVTVAPAGVGTVDYTGSVLSWTGPINQGETVTLTYTVTVKTTPGDHLLKNTVTSTVPGNSCPVGSDSPLCSTQTEVVMLPVTLSVAAKGVDAPASVAPGSVVDYTLTVTNDSLKDRKGLSVVDDLTGIIDDATILTDTLTTSRGEASFNADTTELTWSGDADKDEVVTITYQAKVKDISDGDLVLGNTAGSDDHGSTCPVGVPATSCATSTPISGVVLEKTSDVPDGEKVQTGQKVTYTITAINNSATEAKDATFTDDMSKALDDAVFNDDVVATGEGNLTYSSPKLVWSGDMKPGETVTLTYTVTVNSEITGDRALVNQIVTEYPDANCQPDSNTEDTRCFTAAEIAPKLALTGASFGAMGAVALGLTLMGVILVARKRRKEHTETA